MKHFHLCQSVEGPFMHWAKRDWARATKWIKAQADALEHAAGLCAEVMDNLSEKASAPTGAYIGAELCRNRLIKEVGNLTK